MDKPGPGILVSPLLLSTSLLHAGPCFEVWRSTCVIGEIIVMELVAGCWLLVTMEEMEGDSGDSGRQ